MSKVLCIYHSPCADGFGAAWAVRHALKGDVEFYPGVYGQEPPDVSGRNVMLVDFSYKRPVLNTMAQVARSILIIDHHKTAREDLADVPLAPSWEHWKQWDDPLLSSGIGAYRRATLFDMGRSGAGMAWDYLHAGQSRPRLIDHIEDRDLWRFNLPGTREIQAALFSYPYDFDIWDKLMDSDPMRSLFGEGCAIERKHHKDIAELIPITKRRMTIGGYDVPVASLPYTMSSDAGNVMAKGEAFAACYIDTAEGRVFSLRSANDGADVSAIASGYGGGGHAHAAGFTVTRDHRLASA